MAATYLKKASKTSESSDDTTGPIVKEMLDKIEAVTRVYALDLDGWDGDIVVLEEAFRDVAQVAVRISRLEGHAMTDGAHLAKYFRDEHFELESGFARL